MMTRRRFPPGTAFAALLTAVGLVAATSAPARILSDSAERNIGEQAARQIEAQYGVSKNGSENARVRSIGLRLARVSDRPNLKWEFKVLNNSEINAVSLPGGFVYVFQGLMNAVGSNEPELAGVIAHEVGHVSAHHQADMIERQMAGSLIINLLFSGKTRNIASLFTNIFALKFSRQEEYQADQLGVKFAAKAGFDPYGLPHFLQFLESKYGKGARNGPAAWLSTHPANSERVKRAFKYADQYSRTYAKSRVRRTAK
jgi:predicted Zn-dependent protease